MKLVFIPFSVVAGIVAGLVGKKAFEALWAQIDDVEPPDPRHRDVSWPKVLISTTLQSAVFGLTRALADRGSRLGFYRLTGVWPGDERPEAETEAA